MKKYAYIVVAIIGLNLLLSAQINSVSVGTQLGFGDIKGSVLSHTAFSLGGFVEVSPSFWNIIDFRFDYYYMRKLDSLFPNNSPNRYYPSLQSLSLKVITRQPLTERWFLEEGLGPMALKDKTYSDINEWDYGVSGLINIGIDFQNSENLPIAITIGSNFGLTFTNTTASYLVYHLQLQYFLIN